MFQRAVHLRQAEEALARGLWEEALRLASNPLIAGHRRAREVRRRARDALLERARHRMEKGNLPGARRDLARAGGEATLAEILKNAMGEAGEKAKMSRNLEEKARFFLQAGLPAKVLGLLDRGKWPGSGEIDRLARKNMEEARVKAGSVQNLLERGDREEAEKAWMELLGLDRERALDPELLEALFSRDQPEGGPSWEEAIRTLEKIPFFPQVPFFRKKWEDAASFGLEKARWLLAGGDTLNAGNILDTLGRVSHELPGWGLFLGLRAWKEGLELAEAGRLLEAGGLVREGCAGLDEAFSLQAFQEDGEPPEAWIAREVTRFLGEGAGGTIQSELRRAASMFGEMVSEGLEEILGSSREDLRKGFEFLGEGRPRAALRAFLEVRLEGEERERGIREALGGIRRALEKMGAWRAFLARLGTGAQTAGLAAFLEEAALLDKEVPGLEEARKEAGDAEAFLTLLEETEGDAALGERIRLFCGSPLLPPRGALTLWKFGRERILAFCREALEVGVEREEAALLGAARAKWGLPPDPGFPASSRARKPGMGAQWSPEGNPMDGFILRVAGRGDVLVLPKDSLLLGSAAGRKADLRVLARLGAVEAEFTRTLGFHEGFSFKVRSLGDRPFFLDGKPEKEAVLEESALMRFGPALDVKFRRPRKDSVTVLLEFPGDFYVDGCRRVAWMKVPGWDGALVIGPEEDSHIRIPGADTRVEVAIDGKGRFLLRSTEIMEAGGRTLDREGLVPGFGQVRSGNILFFLDPRNPFQGSSE